MGGTKGRKEMLRNLIAKLDAIIEENDFLITVNYTIQLEGEIFSMDFTTRLDSARPISFIKRDL